MKKTIIAFLVLVLALNSKAEAQIGISGSSINGAILPRVECNVYNIDFNKNIIITGNKSRTYILASRRNNDFSDVTFLFKKESGKAKTTFSLYVNNELKEQWTFFGKEKESEKTVKLSDIDRKEVKLVVKNHSATNKIKASVISQVPTNNMLFNRNRPRKSDSPMTMKITESTGNLGLRVPCNGKGTLEITRIGGNSSAEIIVRRGNTIIRTVQMNANETSKRINLNNLSNINSLAFEIRNIEDDKFLRARIGAWFN